MFERVLNILRYILNFLKITIILSQDDVSICRIYKPLHHGRTLSESFRRRVSEIFNIDVSQNIYEQLNSKCL